MPPRSKPRQPPRKSSLSSARRAELEEWLRRAKNGDRAALNSFIAGNEGLVRTIARGFRGRGVPLEDLHAEGRFGLLIAVEKFDFGRKTQFSSHAAWWVRQRIRRAIEDHSRVVRIPSHVQFRHRAVMNALETLSKAGRVPTDVELARHLDWPVKKVRDVLAHPPRPTVSLDRQVKPDKDRPTFADLLVHPRFKETRAMPEARDLRDRVEAALLSLDAYPQQVVRLRFNLPVLKPVTADHQQTNHLLVTFKRPLKNQEIGDALGRSAQAIRLMVTKAIRERLRYRIPRSNS